MKFCFYLLFFLIIFISQSKACNPNFSHNFFNVSQQRFVSNARQVEIGGGITQEQFDDAIEKVRKVYAPVFTSKGANLVIEKNWDDDTVNARARREDNNWKIIFYGGYARHFASTYDAVLMVACHEIGHHLGGTPFYSDDSYLWSSAEGQADYFANLICLKKIMREDDNFNWFLKNSPTVPLDLNNICTTAYANETDQYLCMRVAMAGYTMNMVWSDNDSALSFSNPDLSVAEKTYSYHPNYQCRLDTSLQGTLCSKSFDQLYLDSFDSLIGTCNLATNDKIGLRPPCWYKEDTSTNIDI